MAEPSCLSSLCIILHGCYSIPSLMVAGRGQITEVRYNEGPSWVTGH